MGIVRRGRIWHYRVWVGGREYTGTTGLAATDSNRTRALSIARKRRAELVEELKRGPAPKAVPFCDAAGQFIGWARDVEYRAHPNTARRLQTSFASLVEFFGERPVCEITPGAVEDYKAWRVREHGVRDVTIRHDLHALSVFYGRYAVKHAWAAGNPVDDVKMPSDAASIVQHVLSAGEEDAYFAAARGTLYDVARLILLTGCRPEEVLSLRADDVDLAGARVHIRAGKTPAARRTLDLTGEAHEILEARAGFAPDHWIFPSSRRPGQHITKLNHQHDEACRLSGVSFRLYDLRHTFATRLAESGCDLPTLATILGHSGLRMVTRYVHPTEQHRREAMKRYEAAIKPRLRRVK